ncbi:MAG: molybdopterin molybdotransferase MoeA [Allomuricauda sp.]
MISYKSALEKVLGQTSDYGNESVRLQSALGRVLNETIVADRDFPPFDRATKDGIAISYTEDIDTNKQFQIAGIAQAGNPQLTLKDKSTCIEVMTGAIVPKDADTVVMYEHLLKEKGGFAITKPVVKGQNIHYKGSDTSKNDELLNPSTIITSSEIGVLASVGKSEVLVKKLPKIAVISTGNELVDVEQEPLLHQIRKSNSHTLGALLEKEMINADLYHLPDEPVGIKTKIKELLHNYDILMLSGGVSKGKFDFLPEVFDELGVQKIFHKVRQRPGKPFWFGQHKIHQTLIFAFPGNPVSTFVNYHTYFLPWLNKTLGVTTPHFNVFLDEPMSNTTDLTLFVSVETAWQDGKLLAKKISSTGSGDVLGLSKTNGFVRLDPNESLDAKSLVSFIPARRIV